MNSHARSVLPKQRKEQKVFLLLLLPTAADEEHNAADVGTSASPPRLCESGGSLRRHS